MPTLISKAWNLLLAVDLLHSLVNMKHRNETAVDAGEQQFAFCPLLSVPIVTRTLFSTIVSIKLSKVTPSFIYMALQYQNTGTTFNGIDLPTSARYATKRGHLLTEWCRSTTFVPYAV